MSCPLPAEKRIDDARFEKISSNIDRNMNFHQPMAASQFPKRMPKARTKGAPQRRVPAAADATASIERAGKPACGCALSLGRAGAAPPRCSPGAEPPGGTVVPVGSWLSLVLMICVTSACVVYRDLRIADGRTRGADWRHSGRLPAIGGNARNLLSSPPGREPIATKRRMTHLKGRIACAATRYANAAARLSLRAYGPPDGAPVAAGLPGNAPGSGKTPGGTAGGVAGACGAACASSCARRKTPPGAPAEPGREGLDMRGPGAASCMGAVRVSPSRRNSASGAAALAMAGKGTGYRGRTPSRSSVTPSACTSARRRPGTRSRPSNTARAGLPSTLITADESRPAANTPLTWTLSAAAAGPPLMSPNRRAASAASGSRLTGGAAGAGAMGDAGSSRCSAQYASSALATPAPNTCTSKGVVRTFMRGPAGQVKSLRQIVATREARDGAPCAKRYDGRRH